MARDEIEIACPQCQRRLRVPVQAAAVACQCPACATVFTPTPSAPPPFDLPRSPAPSPAAPEIPDTKPLFQSREEVIARAKAEVEAAGEPVRFRWILFLCTVGAAASLGLALGMIPLWFNRQDRHDFDDSLGCALLNTAALTAVGIYVFAIRSSRSRFAKTFGANYVFVALVLLVLFGVVKFAKDPVVRPKDAVNLSFVAVGSAFFAAPILTGVAAAWKNLARTSDGTREHHRSRSPFQPKPPDDEAT